MPEPTVTLLQGDMREKLRDIPASSIDVVCTDPPYELEFMGHSWDASGISFDKATWLAVLRVLKPGGHLAAFGGTRTFHRIGVAVEDAGFDIRDSVLWVHSQGFPKSDAHLKPAVEPIIVARKPPIGTIGRTHRRFGTGYFQIDAGRIDAGVVSDSGETGRYPANLAFDPAMGARLDAQAGNRGGGKGEAWGTSRAHVYHAPGKRSLAKDAGRKFGYGDAGGPSRFYFSTEWTDDEMPEQTDPFFYCPKPVVAEREAGLAALDRTRPGTINDHPTVKPVTLMRWLVRLMCPPGAVVLDPFVGSGTTGIAAVIEEHPFVGVEREQRYVKLAQARIAHAQNGGFR